MSLKDQALSLFQQMMQQLQQEFCLLYTSNIKEPTYELTQKKICDLIAQLYFKYDFITEGNALIREEVKLYKKIMNNMDYVDATLSLNYLSGFLYK